MSEHVTDRAHDDARGYGEADPPAARDGRGGLVAVVGLGYVGLPTAAVLAAAGQQVVGVDRDRDLVDSVNRGRAPWTEPDLDACLGGAVARGDLRASTEVPVARAHLIAVPTPVAPDRSPDLTHVRDAVLAVAARLRGGETVVVESTIPPGTTEQVAAWIAAARPDLRPPGGPGEPGFHVAHCPERVLPGRVMIELSANDRVVGGLTPQCASRAADIYRVFCRGEVFETDARTAELVKLAENSFRDVNIAFANELAGVCERLGVDVWQLIELANKHPRVGILSPGPGVGGHCVAVDPWFLVSAAPADTALVRTAREVNDARPRVVIEQVLSVVPDRPTTVACLGLTYKADVDDLRESPAIEVTADLARKLGPRGRILAVEPHVRRLPSELSELGVELVDLDAALDAADVVVLLVDHRAFAAVRGGLTPGTRVVDTRGMLRERRGVPA